jgi:hypothetical protein
MHEYIEVRFFKNTKRLRVKRQVPAGIEFDERDPIERTVGIEFTWRNEATRVRMDTIRRLHGWLPSRFDLRMSVEDGSLVLRGVNEFSLPEGFFWLRLAIEEAEVAGGWKNVNIKHDRHGVVDVDITTDDRSVDVDLDGVDPLIGDVLDRSAIDGVAARDWLEDANRRPTRQACLLNLLASLRTRPKANDSLITLVDHVFFAANDRIYAKVDRAFMQTLKALATDDALDFYEEGSPNAAIHDLLLARVDEPPDVKGRFQGLWSFRGEAKKGPSLQAVVAVAPPDLGYTYAEFDLDLGNPLQDVVGFFVHMGELFDGKPTNHLDLRKDLIKTNAKAFLYYKVVSA